METDESTAQLQPKISAMYFSKLKEGIKIDKYEQSLRKKKLSKFTGTHWTINMSMSILG